MPKEKLKEMLSFRVSVAIYELVEAASASERRELSDVARALIERGLAAYRRDGQLFEPQTDASGSGGSQSPATITGRHIVLGEEVKKKRRA